MHLISSLARAGRIKHPFLILTLLIITAGCGLPAPTDPGPPPAEAPAAAAESAALMPGDHNLSLTYDGIDRTYILHVPAAYDASKPAPLVLAFHGLGLNATEMIRISNLNEEADRSGFIAAYPDGTGENKSWNGGSCCAEAARDRVDDVGFTAALIDEISRLANIDSRRIYATGFSNGAIFTYRLDCELSERLAAIGPVSATQFLEDQQACRPARSLPVIHFHGTADRLNPYDGGVLASGLQAVPVEDAVRFWAQANACPEQAEETTSGRIRHTVYGGCAQGADIELYTIEGGEHAWPGGEAVNARVGEPVMEISASSLMWQFFAAHPLP